MCQPTADELASEDLADRARAHLRKEWMTTRAGKIYDRATGMYDEDNWIIRMLEAMQEAYVLDYLATAMLSMSEADEEARDPYASRGLHRSMFV